MHQLSLFHDVRLETTVSPIRSRASAPGPSIIIMIRVFPSCLLSYLAHYSVLTNQRMGA